MNTPNRIQLELAGATIAYGLGIWSLNHIQLIMEKTHFALALLPCLPLIYMASIIMRALARLDELQRKIITEAMAFAGLVTGFVCFSYLFVRDLGAPEFKAEWAFYLLLLFYAVGMVWSKRRFQ
ncbi:MAG: hypothetical protein U1F46_04930 [Marinagarivorans sp.]